MLAVMQALVQTGFSRGRSSGLARTVSVPKRSVPPCRTREESVTGIMFHQIDPFSPCQWLIIFN